MRRAAWPLLLLLVVVPVIATGLKAVHGDGPLPTGLEQDVTRAMNDLRRLQTAIKAYQVDNGSLPQPNPPIPGRLHWWGFAPNSLTTPFAYIESLPANPFADNENQTLWGMVSDEPENLTYLYINDLSFARWSIGSIVTRHPDHEGFTIPEIWHQRSEGAQFAVLSAGPDTNSATIWGAPQFYDPSNGVASFGDLLVFSNEQFENNALYGMVYE